jgi:hypothetical protein
MRKPVMLSAAKDLRSPSSAAEPEGQLRRSFARRKARRAPDDMDFNHRVAGGGDLRPRGPRYSFLDNVVSLGWSNAG